MPIFFTVILGNLRSSEPQQLYGTQKSKQCFSILWLRNKAVGSPEGPSTHHKTFYKHLDTAKAGKPPLSSVKVRFPFGII